MDLPGRKLKDYESSITKSSSEYFEQNCDPCLTIGQCKQAHAYCEDCQELLCKNCYSYHLRTKALKNHKLILKGNTESLIHSAKDSDMFTEECSLHKHEKIKFFCPAHGSLGCHDCIALKHRTCDIYYIPEKCAAIGDSDEYKEVIRKLDQKLREIGEVTERAKLIENEIDVSHTSLLDEIAKLRIEINNRLDQLQMEIQTDADKIRIKDKKDVERVLETCASLSSDIDKLQSSLQDHKACIREGQLYITMKRAQSKLKLNEIKAAEEILGQTHVRCLLDRSDDLNNLLTRHFKFGKVNFTRVAETQTNDTSIGKLTFKEDINVKTESDRSECRITGCVILPSDRLVLADNCNNKLKIVDTQNQAVIEEQTLDSAPFDITALPESLSYMLLYH